MEPKRVINDLIEDYLEYGQYELNYSPQTIIKYRDCIRCFVREIGNKEVKRINAKDFLKLKKNLMIQGLSASRIANVVYSMKSFLGYCANFLQIPIMNLDSIRSPKIRRKEVVYLTRNEINRFIETIDLNVWHEFRFRVLVEVLLGTGIRIGEALSLNRNDIDWEKREARIMGKGNKERRIFFTDRSLYWIRKYLDARTDNHEAIFVTRDPCNRLNRDDVWRFFGHHRRMVRIDKKITPHILRHTVATNLVFNGCPIIHVKEILGHERIDTTIKYYLGVDREKAKRAHQQYLTFLN